MFVTFVNVSIVHVHGNVTDWVFFICTFMYISIKGIFIFHLFGTIIQWDD